MTDFIDVKKKRTVRIEESFIAKQASALASGATIAIMSPNVNWVEIDTVVGAREQKRNEPKGAVFTKPNDKQFLLETVWEDRGDAGQFDGDMSLFTEVGNDILTLERLNPSEIKKRFPKWHPYHHENKDYLK